MEGDGWRKLLLDKGVDEGPAVGVQAGRKRFTCRREPWPNALFVPQQFGHELPETLSACASRRGYPSRLTSPWLPRLAEPSALPSVHVAQQRSAPARLPTYPLCRTMTVSGCPRFCLLGRFPLKRLRRPLAAVIRVAPGYVPAATVVALLLSLPFSCWFLSFNVCTVGILHQCAPQFPTHWYKIQNRNKPVHPWTTCFCSHRQRLNAQCPQIWIIPST
jgi:hypothetical protein